MNITILQTDITILMALYYFFVYGFLGWMCEVLYSGVRKNKFINRGFLNGPICPLYGIGALLVMILTYNFIDNYFLIFFISFILTSSIEFVTGFILEKLFNRKWWDYSNKKYNIKGYICLPFSIFWGVLCLLIVKVINRPLRFAFDSIDIDFVIVAIGMMLLIFIFDITVSVINATKFKNRFTILDKLAEEIKRPGDFIGQGIYSTYEKASDKYNELVEKIKASRLSKAFPNLINNIKKVDKTKKD